MVQYVSIILQAIKVRDGAKMIYRITNTSDQFECCIFTDVKKKDVTKYESA